VRVDLRGWRGEKYMSEQATAKTLACSEYQQLFEACASAREILNEQREEIVRTSSASVTTADEVLRSQVKYAQACLLLRNHAQSCFRCQLDEQSSV